jgi:hypothetical protein
LPQKANKRSADQSSGVQMSQGVLLLGQVAQLAGSRSVGDAVDVSRSDRLTFLVDSNVFITLEPHMTLSKTEPFDFAARFVRLVHEHGHRLAVHEGTIDDLQRDQDVMRRSHSEQALKKYKVIGDLPVSERISAAIPGASASDRVDVAIASALDANAAHFLVTEDQRLRRRVQSAAVDLADRVLSLSEAVEYLEWLNPAPKPPPPRSKWRNATAVSGSANC